MTTATLGYLQVQKKIKSKVDSLDFPLVNWKMLCFAGFFISLALLVFYVWQINDLTRGFYLINSYENKISQLTQENKDLQVSFAESSFLSQAFAKIEALNFQKVTSVKYMQILDNSFAAAK